MSPRARAVIGWVVTVGLAAVVVVGMFMGDTRTEDRVAAIGSSIKCPVCQGEAIADSPSETAQAMVDIVREKVEAGESDEQIFAFFRDRYGEGILLDPPFAAKTLLLWLIPLGAIAGGVFMILSRRRRPEMVSGGAS